MNRLSGRPRVNPRSERRGNGLPAGHQCLDFAAEESERQTRSQGPVATGLGHFPLRRVKAELWHGAEKYGNRERRRRALDMLFAPFVSLPFDDEAAGHYAKIRHELELQGRAIGPNDLKIAAIARAHALTLVSADPEFSRAPGLKVEDWTQS